MLAGRDPVPPREPRPAANQIARPTGTAGDATELSRGPGRPGDDDRRLEDLAPHLPKPDDAAPVVEEFWPGAQIDSDAGLLEHAKKTGSTTFHQPSTCMMGSHDKAVVDTELRVHG